MATRKTSSKSPASRSSKPSRRPPSGTDNQTLGSVTSTMSGPSHPHAPPFDGDHDLSVEWIADQKAGAQALCEAMPHNPLKATDFGLAAGHHPQAGPTVEPHSVAVSASTVQEDRASDKLGHGAPVIGCNLTNGPLDRVRVDSGGQALTTNQGVKISDNQNSLKAGLRGPTLLEDFVLREKITHFDHERIPERVVHARGSAAHGVFECYEALDAITCADLFSHAGKCTPVFSLPPDSCDKLLLRGYRDGRHQQESPRRRNENHPGARGTPRRPVRFPARSWRTLHRRNGVAPRRGGCLQQSRCGGGRIQP